VVFENLEEFFQFACSAELRMEGKTLLLPVSLLGRMKEFQLPLEEMELTGEWRLRKDILELEGRLARKEEESALAEAQLLQKEETIADLTQRVAQLADLVKER
jgi:hypothetical protein